MPDAERDKAAEVAPPKVAAEGPRRTRGPGTEPEALGLGDAPLGRFLRENLSKEALEVSQRKSLAERRERLDTAKALGDPEIATAQAEVDRIAAENAELLSSEVLGGSTTLATVPTGFNERVQAANTPQQIGSRTTTTSRPNVSPEVIQQAAGAIDFEARAMSAQLDAQAAGMGIRSNLYQDLRLAQQENVFPLLQEAQKIFDDANKQLAGIQEMADDVRANRINPGQFFANIEAAGTFAASMAVAAGHLAAALGGGPNVALSVINGAIERNMRAQELNQAHDRAVLNAEIQIFDRMRTLGVDRLNQANVYNGLLIAQAQSGLEAAAAATASVELRAQIGVVQAQLAQKKAELFMRAAGTIQASQTMKLFALQSGAQSSAREGAAAVVNRVLQEQLSGLPEDAQLTPELQQSVFSAIRGELAQADTTLSDTQISQMVSNSPLFRGAETQDLRPIERADVTTAGDRQYIKTEEFTSKTPKWQEDKEDQLRANVAMIKKWQRLLEVSDLVTTTSGTGGVISKLAGYNNETANFFFQGGSGDPRVNQLGREMTSLLNSIVVLTKTAQSGKMEAVHGPGEFAMFQLQAEIPSDAAGLITMITEGQFRDQVAPGLRTAIANFKQGWTGLYSNIGTP